MSLLAFLLISALSVAGLAGELSDPARIVCVAGPWLFAAGLPRGRARGIDPWGVPAAAAALLTALWLLDRGDERLLAVTDLAAWAAWLLGATVAAGLAPPRGRGAAVYGAGFLVLVLGPPAVLGLASLGTSGGSGPGLLRLSPLGWTWLRASGEELSWAWPVLAAGALGLVALGGRAWASDAEPDEEPAEPEPEASA